MVILLTLGFLLTLLLGWELNERLLERKRLASQCLETVGETLKWVNPSRTHLSHDAGQRRFRRLNLGLLQDGIDHLKASPLDHRHVIQLFLELQRTVLRAQWKLDKGKMTDQIWLKDMKDALQAFHACRRAMKPSPVRLMRTWIGL
jgi:hypothetical protein